MIVFFEKKNPFQFVENWLMNSHLFSKDNPLTIINVNIDERKEGRMSSEKKGGGKIDEHTNKEKLIKGRVLIKKRKKTHRVI